MAAGDQPQLDKPGKERIRFFTRLDFLFEKEMVIYLPGPPPGLPFETFILEKSA